MLKISREHKSDLQRIDHDLLTIGEELLAKASTEEDRAEIRRMMAEIMGLKTGIAYDGAK
jgi:cob(I)alamin adenosyltransferase